MIKAWWRGWGVIELRAGDIICGGADSARTAANAVRAPCVKVDAYAQWVALTIV